MVPCTTKVEKYKKIYNSLERFKDNCYNLSQKEDIEKRELGFRFYNFNGKDCVVVFERMFFVYEDYIERPYKTKNKTVTIKPSDYDTFQNQVIEVLGYLRDGFNFQKYQPDFNRIEKLMLEVKAEKENTKFSLKQLLLKNHLTISF